MKSEKEAHFPVQIDKSIYTETYLGKVGELTLKGGNIHVFEKQLAQNLRLALESQTVKVRLLSGRLYVHCGKKSCEAVEFALDHLIGITGWAKVLECEKDLTSLRLIVRKVGEESATNGNKTFKIDCRREDKTFPLNSYQIAVETADVITVDSLLSVDVHSPDATIFIEIRDKCYVYCTQKKTCRGLPVGVSGKGLLLLSGGIDSPVAGYRMLRRGMKLDCVYFHSYPYTSDEAQKKVETLARTLSMFGNDVHLNVLSFTDVQMQIKKSSPESYSTLMLRLCMMKASNLLAERTGAGCLITGESLGQVASQTLENLSVTESFASLPLMRPLIGMDKEEITETARFIGTYSTSILPYEDCCVLFSPKHPVLRASVSEAKEIFDEMKIEELIQKSFDERKIFRYSMRDIIKEQWQLDETC